MKPPKTTAAELARVALAALAISTGGLAQAQIAAADCINTAAAFHQVNAVTLRAIAYHESRMRSWEVRRNSNGTFDIGLYQVNTVHLSELANYGIGPAQLQDACVSAFVGAWLYRKKINVYGNTWTAVGAYHSETPSRRDDYARKIQALVKAWGY